jgi:hypothetical protein
MAVKKQQEQPDVDLDAIIEKLAELCKWDESSSEINQEKLKNDLKTKISTLKIKLAKLENKYNNLGNERVMARKYLQELWEVNESRKYCNEKWLLDNLKLEFPPKVNQGRPKGSTNKPKKEVPPETED